ncbi:uncharacterized protein FA14DRAFT_177552 [Meira miltonrushii]|uniref:Uncharacterized protein n=1 Tax=Meira miltonrushii TaxID=1280837 RepID=A0A316VKW9_9BASI|nr:uncharacterized protein FA14DRAFT_177552 [Meira miltonrushii]PWN38279.1 hypothetical protein FA14DRAFT_177552 [Meira miltonrushii]
MNVATPLAQRETTHSNMADETTATEEPPDISGLRIDNSQNDRPTKSKTLPSLSIGFYKEGNSSTHQSNQVSQKNVSLLSTSLDTSIKRATASGEANVRLSPSMPHSPSVAESTGGSASDYDYEHEPDSPSSMSSWNSWAGGRRGDLADVEDLELDGVTMGEPELETVSEMDEESSGFVSGSDRPINESDDDNVHHRQPTRSTFNDHSPRRKFQRHNLGDSHPASHNHHHHSSHHASQLHPHGPPIHPHFSPRAGGHGLSHASRYLLRAPPNLAARRRNKGRLAELAEEGTGGAITTTKMPTPTSPEKEKEEGTSKTEEPAENSAAPALPASISMPPQDSHGHPDHVEMEIFGPPALPVRSVSPSETIPVVPSPLCVCLTADDEKGDVTEVITPTNEGSHFDSFSLDTPTGLRTPTPPSPSASGRSDSYVSASTAITSPATSPQLLSRKGSGRSRRSSSPGRSKPKIPLRPCFKRRGSAQMGSALTTGNYAGSSSESEKTSSRGRTKVRFSPAPPTEVRTHSPVEYDRKACPISNRLSPEDLEELRTMKMEMGLLEAKCAALAACKGDQIPSSPGRFSTHHSHGGDWTESESESENGLHPPYQMPTGDRKRADSISSSSPSTFCGSRFAQRDGKDGNGASRMTPAEYLRMEREKERERVCRMAGIGTGVGFRYTGGNPNTRQMPHGGCETFGASSIISRFGLSKPPPPLPGMVAPCSSSGSGSGSSQPHSPGTPTHGQYANSNYNGGASLYRPNSAPPVRGSGYDSGNAFPQVQDAYEIEAEAEEVEAQKQDDTPRGRSMEKSTGRNANHNSTSTDATVTEYNRTSNVPGEIPSFKRTCPSPPSSIDSQSPVRNRSMSPCTTRYDPNMFYGSPSAKPTRPGIRPIVGAQSSPSYELAPSPSACGYDSPASEFCYESGSEYDLIG